MALLEETPTYLPGTLAWTTREVAKMLRTWNFEEGSGLGRRGQGIVAPVQAAMQSGRAGIGYCGTELYHNGLPTKPLFVVQDEWQRLHEERLRALAVEVDCCDKAIALLRDKMMQDQDDDSFAETADALAALMESREVWKRPRTPGMWKAALPSSAIHYVVEQIIKPGMAAEVQKWLPAWDPACDDWLRHWISLLGARVVESKVNARADKLDYYYAVAPCKEYMGPKLWGMFRRRHVVPMLARLVRELRITPPKQTDPSFRTVMLWSHLVPVQDMVSMLEGELFFERYEAALRHWMQSAAKPPLSKAVAWCAGWKKLFPPELLDQERVIVRLDAVVALVDGEAYDAGRPDQQSFQAGLLVDGMQRLQFVL